MSWRPGHKQTDNKIPGISEDTLHKQCMQWFKYAYSKYALNIWHPANGGSRNIIEATKLKSMGVLSGVCDIIITVPRGEWCGLFIELKVGKNTLSKQQQDFIKAHQQHYSCHVARSLDEFMSIVKAYFKLQ